MRKLKRVAKKKAAGAGAVVRRKAARERFFYVRDARPRSPADFRLLRCGVLEPPEGRA